MVMLSVYFDESYNQQTEKEPNLPLVYTIGGYLSSKKQWMAFEREWDKVLKKENIPHFHMSDFESGFSYYKGWSKEKRIKFLQKLHSIIQKYVLKGFATSIVLEDFNGLTFEQKRVFGEPHMCALVSCMKHIKTMCDELDFNEPIAYVFEDGSGYNGLISELLTEMNDEARKGYRIGSVSFLKKDCIPLQASDIVAYEVTKELARQRDNNSQRKTRESIKNLAVSRIDEWFYMDRRHFLETLAFVKEKGLWDGEI